jgi:ribosomal protein S18 acetylase RimI-like enzyme
MEISFRQIKNEDFEFLWRLHNLALKKYVRKTWGWDEDHQRRMFERDFNPNNGQIIVVDSTNAGYLWVNEKELEMFLVSIRLLPEYQNKGIGTKVIQNLIRQSDKPIRLQVLKINPARKLYERLGFEIDSETETHFLMKKHAAQK